ncbi:hypothetical protein GEMRC1_006818 [Eukaryota sp. GEM-RC1]
MQNHLFLPFLLRQHLSLSSVKGFLVSEQKSLSGILPSLLKMLPALFLTIPHHSIVKESLEIFQQICLKVHQITLNYSESSWIKRGVARNKYETEFRECHQLLNEFTQELVLALATTTNNISDAKIKALNELDSEDFQTVTSDQYLGKLKHLNEKELKIQSQITSTFDSNKIQQLEKELQDLTDYRTELTEELPLPITSEPSSSLSDLLLIPESDIHIDESFSKVSGQSEILFAQWMQSDVVIKLYHQVDEISPALVREWEILSSVPNVPSLPRVFGVCKLSRGGGYRYGLVMERLSKQTLTEKVQDSLSLTTKLLMLTCISSALSICHDHKFLL